MAVVGQPVENVPPPARPLLLGQRGPAHAGEFGQLGDDGGLRGLGRGRREHRAEHQVGQPVLVSHPRSPPPPNDQVQPPPPEAPATATQDEEQRTTRNLAAVGCNGWFGPAKSALQRPRRR